MAKRKLVERTRAGKTMTEAAFFGMMRSALRRVRWKPKYEALTNAKKYVTLYNEDGTEVLLKSGKNKGKPKVVPLYTCADCREDFRGKDVQVDHMVPCGSLKCWDDLVSFAQRLYCEADKLRVLCLGCHQKISNKENKILREISNIREAHPREEGVWQGMLQRCNNQKAVTYKWYGGKGVKVCARWNASFFNFLDDMGERPEGLTLDRIDNTKGYSKDNCRWATWKEQARNKSDNSVVEFEGESNLICEWAEQLNIKPNTITYRLKRGWSVAEALEKIDREKPFYSGRLTDGELQFIIDETKRGVTQTEIGRVLGIDVSQVSRILKKITNKEREERTK